MTLQKVPNKYVRLFYFITSIYVLIKSSDIDMTMSLKNDVKLSVIKSEQFIPHSKTLKPGVGTDPGGMHIAP